MKLSKVFAALEPEFVLGTTYTLSLAFFESVVLPHIERQHLKRCLLLCDSHGLEMAMSEAPALQHAARDYMVATAPSPGTFHSKVWLLLSKSEMILLVGSGNLTQPGFVENIELFDAVRLTAGNSGRELAFDVLDFLRGLAGLWQGISDPNLLAVQTLREMIDAAAGLAAQLTPSVEPSVRFLSSFKGAFPAQLAALRPDTAYVAAPYFGNSIEGLKRLQSALGTKRTFVFPAIHRDGKLDLPMSAAARIPGVKVRSLAIAAAHPTKFTHLKLYGLRTAERQSWLFTSSVNCTLAALEGPNVEAGLLRRVAEDDLPAYFEATDLSSEDSGSHISVQSSKAAWLIMWATDMGDHISIELAPTCHARIPLTKVKIELKSAQRNAFTVMPQAFTHAGTERVAWRYFGEFRSHLRNAAVLRVTATDANGRAVTGQCLVDDFATLTSDPVHRSAWRAAVALLGAEGMPDYADVAALFSLAEVAAVDDESDGELEDATKTAKRVAGSTKDTKREKAAVWPPTPLLDDTVPVGHYGHGAGNIYWFNRILATFLSRTATDPNSAGGETETMDAGDDEGTSNHGKTKADAAPGEATDEFSQAAHRLWDQAADAMKHMLDRLHRLEVTDVHAHRIWGPATFVFLGVLHIARAIRRKHLVMQDSIPSHALLICTWLEMMLADRDQGRDYVGTSSSIYKGRYFPSLARDLCIRFGEAPHPDVLGIICVAFAHARASCTDRRKPTLVQWLVLRDLTGDLMNEVFRERSHLEHLWKAYFQDAGDSVTWKAMQQNIDELQRITWLDHPGYRDVTILERLRKDKQLDGTAELSDSASQRLMTFMSRGCKSVKVSRYDVACWNTNCVFWSSERPELQCLRELTPVICPGCGLLMVPDLLEDAVRRWSNG